MKPVPETKIKLTDLKDVFDHGYDLLGIIRDDVDAPVAKVKFLTEEVIAIYGEEAARKFYDPTLFKREGAMPKPVFKTLFGEDGVQSIDGKAHRHRKDYFMDLMEPERIEDYAKILDKHLKEELAKQKGKFELFELANLVLFKAVSEWSGINLGDLSEDKIKELAENQISMISGAITSPKDHIKSISDRNDSEDWAEGLIKEARENPIPGKEHLALYSFAQASDLEGDLLPIEVAAVELLNIIRPTVAITVWIALMGHALFKLDGVYDELKADFEKLQDPFIQELRRYYPFFPMLPAISVDDVEIDGYHIPKGAWTVLDLYGSNHDKRTINKPEEFNIRRYLGRAEELSYEEEYEMIAHGGGNFREMHRCAGEWITLYSLRVFSDHLVKQNKFSIPKQNWEIPINQFPTYPKDRVLLFKE